MTPPNPTIRELPRQPNPSQHRALFARHNMKINKRKYPWIILTVFVSAVTIAVILGLRPMH